MLIKVICNNCKEEFYKQKAEIKRRKTHYCSAKCYKDKTRVEKAEECLFCHKKICSTHSKQKFCSHSCAASFNNSGTIRNGTPLTNIPCLYCKSLFLPKTHNAIYCSKKCSSNAKKEKTIIKFLNGELSDNQVRKDTVREYLIEKQSGLCIICGNLPVHNNRPLIFIVDHIDGIFTNNNPNNIRAICPNCNSQTDTFAGKNVGRNSTKRSNK